MRKTGKMEARICVRLDQIRANFAQQFVISSRSPLKQHTSFNFSPRSRRSPQDLSQAPFEWTPHLPRIPCVRNHLSA